MPARTLRRFSLLLAVCVATLLLTNCSTPETTIRSTVSESLERPIPGVFVAIEEVDRSYLNLSMLKIQLVDALQGAGLETKEVTYNPLTFDERPGISEARDASLPFALVVTFEGGKVKQKVDGVPLPASFNVDASLYDAETEERVWRGVLDAAESDSTEAILTNRIIGALQEDGVIPGAESAGSDRE